MIGSMTYQDEFPEALRSILSGQVSVAPLVTHRLPLAEIGAAFTAHRDPASIKVASSSDGVRDRQRHPNPLRGDRHGDPALLVNGLGSPAASWVLQVKALTPHFRAVTLDNHGMGESDLPPDSGYTTAQLAAAAAALLRHLKIDRAHVVGASMGGTIVSATSSTRGSTAPRSSRRRRTSSRRSSAQWPIGTQASRKRSSVRRAASSNGTGPV